jgi:hypothetical protein
MKVKSVASILAIIIFLLHQVWVRVYNTGPSHLGGFGMFAVSDTRNIFALCKIQNEYLLIDLHFGNKSDMIYRGKYQNSLAVVSFDYRINNYVDVIKERVGSFIDGKLRAEESYKTVFKVEGESITIASKEEAESQKIKNLCDEIIVKVYRKNHRDKRITYELLKELRYN